MRRRRNPIEVESKGQVITRSKGGIALDDAKHFEIYAKQDGQVRGKLDLFYDESDQQASIELIEVVPSERNKGNAVLALLRAAFALAKKIGAERMHADATWYGIYRIAVRVKKPIVARANDVLRRIAEKNRVDSTWYGNILTVPLEQVPETALLYSYSDPETARMAPFYETGPRVKPGVFFNTGMDVFKRISASAEVDRLNVIKRVHNIAVEWGKRGAPDYLVDRGAGSTLEDLGRLLPKKSGLDSKKLKLDRLPMLSLWWDV